ncbi:SMP-30/gluconolactonase/LRE family protein [Mycolicibacterium sp. S2-37]|uniref:SMP-30/gluconolactonase/LRE family protein n=1 Tax=Mycolicibacterium sp. S2-37 TaxID=2810297 RepID=UPI001A94D10A|nr:SMP-30/gluconolactonase/LRE family protein [Mycolicibacterium sp. S2-37]MBO0680446.1 SMP-30/gluconolactonase/LRE family protein [Mycolicibacterium sp. S2-37]
MSSTVARTTERCAGPWSVAVAAGAQLGEHPVWDARARRLIWTDCAAGTVHASDAHGDTVVWSEPEGAPIGVSLLRANGGLAIATGTRVLLLDDEGREDRPPVEVPIDTAVVRFNDGSCDPAGRLLVGTTGGDVDGLGELYCVEPDGRVRRLLGGLTEANGIGWSPNGRRMYFVDSGEPVVHAFDYDPQTGCLGHRSEFAKIDPAVGYLDGLTVDASGDVWAAVWAGGQLRRYGPEGDLRAVLRMPVSHPTCPGFGGVTLDTLYVTSAASPGALDEPWSGHVLAWPGAGRGLEPNRYCG